MSINPNAVGAGSCMLISMSSFAEPGLDVTGARADLDTSLGGKPEMRISKIDITVSVPNSFTEDEQTGLEKAADAYRLRSKAGCRSDGIVYFRLQCKLCSTRSEALMGLDCVPLGIAKPGHEAEWQQILERLYQGEQIPDDLRERLLEISMQAYEVLEAPVVGDNARADAWALHHKPEDSSLSDAEFLEQMAGYRVLRLVPQPCPGLPRYTNAPAYDEVDETSFRGAFLQSCEQILGKELLERAWTDVMRPEEAVEYGQALLDAAERARAAGPPPPEASKGFLSKLFGGPKEQSPEDDTSFDEQLEILEVAGAWYRFWGERGHPIWGYY